MTSTAAYAAETAKSPIAPFRIERREPGPTDVLIDILYCGVCHSDIHQARDEWGGSVFPMVPGHEIVGRVAQVGHAVASIKAGDQVGVGCMVGSCGHCDNCRAGEEQYCTVATVWTYNSHDAAGQPTYGGYSKRIVVDQKFVLKVPPTNNLAAVAPLLCAGITTYSPLRHYNVGPGTKLGVIGLGGLGHMALKFGHAFGAHVVQFTTSPSKVADAKRLGADEVVMSNDPAAVEPHKRSFDVIIDTVSAEHDINGYLQLLRRDGALVLVGVPEQPFAVSAFSVIVGRKTLTGSAIGGIKETQEMLDYCAEHGIVSDIEMVAMKDINHAYDRMIKNDVKYRFVIDLATLSA